MAQIRTTKAAGVDDGLCVGFIFSLVAHSVGFSPLSSLLCLFPIIPFTLAPPCLFVHLVWFFLLMCFDATHLPLSVSTFDSLPDNDFPPIPLSIYIKSRLILQPPGPSTTLTSPRIFNLTCSLQS